MRVLLVALEAPTGPRNGLRLPLQELLDGVRAHHDVTLVARQLPGQPPTGAPGDVLVPVRRPRRTALLVDAARGVVTRTPTSSARAVADVGEEVARELARGRPHVVHVFGGPLAALAPHLGGAPAILTAMDAASLNALARAEAATGVRRLLLHDEARRIVAEQRRHHPRYDRVVMVTEDDAAVLRRLAPRASVAVVPNGVEVPADDGRRSRTGDGPVVLFHGALSYAPNVVSLRHLLADIWPLVHAVRPDATLELVGRAPSAEVQRLADRDGVHLVGEVPDVWPWLRGADVHVCPMTAGTGIKNKVLEAMAAGLACVASPLAAQGLGARDGEHLRVVSGAEATAQAVLDLLADETARAALGDAARAHVRRERSWERYVANYLGLYADVAEGRP